MSDETTATTETCTDPDCASWVRIELPLPVSIIGRIASAMPEGTMWVYAEPPQAGFRFSIGDPPVVVKPGYANLHTPHGWYDDGSEMLTVDPLRDLEDELRAPIAARLAEAADDIGANAPSVAQLLNHLADVAARER